MLELYFCPRVVCRLRTNAHVAVLEGLLVDLHRRGYARNTIQNYVRAAEVFLRWIRRRRKPLNTVDEATIHEFTGRRPCTKRPRSNAHAALSHLLQRLRDEQVVPASAPVERPAIARIVAEFDAYLDHTCGLAAATRVAIGCTRRGGWKSCVASPAI